jgi:hypothetical protein
VALIAHLQRLTGHELQIERTPRGERGGERRSKLAGHPVQALQHTRVVGAEPQHLAQALVEVGEGTATVGLVVDHQDGHRRRDHPSHRSDGGGGVARSEGDLARLELVDRTVGVGSPALEQSRPD